MIEVLHREVGVWSELGVLLQHRLNIRGNCSIAGAAPETALLITLDRRAGLQKYGSAQYQANDPE
jgi:hypothetical protein